LLNVAAKRLGSNNFDIDQLTPVEQNLRNSFENAEIYEFLTGEPNTIPELSFKWIQPCSPEICFPAEVLKQNQQLAPQQQQQQQEQQTQPAPASSLTSATNSIYWAFQWTEIKTKEGH